MKKILIIEDDQLVANIYRNRLAREGFQVEIAPDGEAGLSQIHSHQPDLVILDLLLPKVLGIDLMRKIRAEPQFEKLPFIVFSNTFMTTMMQEAWKAGATKCLSKTDCTPKQLIQVVHSVLGTTPPAAPAATPTVPANAAPSPTVSAAPPPAPTPAPAPAQTVQPAPAQAPIPKPIPSVVSRPGFTNSLRAHMGTLRTLLQGLTKAEDDATKLRHLEEIQRCAHAVCACGGVEGLRHLARMAEAFEALIKELHARPEALNGSSLRTVATTIDFLGLLCEQGHLLERQDLPPTNILVVDDEIISRRAVAFSLDKAGLKSVSVSDPQTAYSLLTSSPFDLVFLDVDMPQMTGFELCTKLRTLPSHKRTPVVFVTSLSDFRSRATSTISGGNDLIAKPFLSMELAVKALGYILRGQLEAVRGLSPATRPSGVT